jgi:hypothetical protein
LATCVRFTSSPVCFCRMVTFIGEPANTNDLSSEEFTAKAADLVFFLVQGVVGWPSWIEGRSCGAFSADSDHAFVEDRCKITRWAAALATGVTNVENISSVLRHCSSFQGFCTCTSRGRVSKSTSTEGGE